MSEPVERLRSFLMDGCNARAEDLRDAFDDLASLGAEREERIKYANEAVRLMRIESELESRIEVLEKLLEEGRAILSNESIVKIQGDLVGQVVFGSWSERVDAALAAEEPDAATG